MRRADTGRTTKETDVRVRLELDSAEPEVSIATGIPFFDHMLDLFGFHSGCGLNITAKGDIEIDFHHTVEDVGICLGQAVQQALSDKHGINRYGFYILPMDEARAEVALDFSGRPYCVWEGIRPEGLSGQFDVQLIEEFFQAFSIHAGVTLHIIVPSGKNLHHIVEAVFKCFARAFKAAAAFDGTGRLPSTKGSI